MRTRCRKTAERVGMRLRIFLEFLQENESMQGNRLGFITMLDLSLPNGAKAREIRIDEGSPEANLKALGELSQMSAGSRAIESEILTSTALKLVDKLDVITRRFTASNDVNVQSTPKTGKLISEAITDFRDYQLEEGRWQCMKTEIAAIKRLCLFQEIVGDLDIGEIDAKTIAYYKSTVRGLPPGHRIGRRYKGKTIAQILKMKPRTTLAFNTYKMHFSNVKSLFAWAYDADLIDRDYKTLLSVKKRKKDERPDRAPFSIDELKAIFESQAFLNRKKPEYYWVPLLALYSGARVNELCQMKVSDIQEYSEGLWAIYISAAGEGQRLKNKSSWRSIPVHSNLISLGLIGYRYSVIEKHGVDAQLFPNINPTRDGFSKNVSRNFNEELLKEVGVKQQTNCFHSLRHSISDHLKKAVKASLHVAGGILGHSDTSMTFGTYGSDMLPEDLREAIEKIDFRIEHPVTPNKFLRLQAGNDK